MNQPFERFTTGCARFAGRPGMLFVCIGLALFAVYSYTLGDDRLEWIASLSISVVTVILLPILQETQNRDSAAIHAKLDELIKTDAEARNALIGLENRTVEEIEEIRIDEEVEAGSGPGSASPGHRWPQGRDRAT